MKVFLQIIATVFAVAILFSCKQKEAEKNTEKIIYPGPLVKKEIEITLMGEFISRRSYYKLQTPELQNKSEKEIDKYLREQENSNPEIIESSDTDIIKHLTRLGLVRKGEFLLNKFKGSDKESFEYADSAGKKYKIKLIRNETNYAAKLVIYTSTDSVVVDTKRSFSPEFKFAIMDVIPGGNKELVLLHEYHISNGDNSDLFVYGIKTN